MAVTRRSARRANGADEDTSPMAPQSPAQSMDKEAEEFAKRMEPVAPWNRPDIPDYGPVKDGTMLAIFIVVGVAATCVYEYTDYFDEVNRYLAYVAIWAPLWMRLLTRVSPALTEEEQDALEERRFQEELARLAREAEADEEGEEEEELDQQAIAVKKNE